MNVKAVAMVLTCGLVLLVLAFLPAIVFILAHLGLALSFWWRDQPDRLLSYKVEFVVNETESLVLNGTIECAHYSGMNGHGFTTPKPFAYATSNQVRWLISGLNCRDAMEKKPHSGYVLYKLEDQSIARAYFPNVTKGVYFKNEQFTWSELGKPAQNYPEIHAYSSGPFLFSMHKLNKAAEPPASGDKPVLLAPIKPLCAAENQPFKSLESSSIDKILQDAESEPHSVGTLNYAADLRSWRLDGSSSALKPLTVIARELPKSPGAPIVESCLKLRLADDAEISIPVSSVRHSAVYLPAERVVLRIYDVEGSPQRLSTFSSTVFSYGKVN